MIKVEVAYARPESQSIIAMDVEEGTTAEQAVQRSGMLEKYADIDFDSCKLGVFGKAIKRDKVLEAGDRVEIYRPLIADPKEVRRQRAAEGKKMKKGGGDA